MAPEAPAQGLLVPVDGIALGTAVSAGWVVLAIAAPLGLAVVVGLLRGYAIRVLIWRQLKDEDEPR